LQTLIGIKKRYIQIESREGNGPPRKAALPLESIQLVLVLLIVIVIGGGLGLSNSKSDGKSLNPIREIRAVSAGSRP